MMVMTVVMNNNIFLGFYVANASDEVFLYFYLNNFREQLSTKMVLERCFL